MAQAVPTRMQAVAIDNFGGVDELRVQTLPVPQIDTDEILMRVEAADVAEWDPYEREGGFAELFGTQPSFPYVLGTGGAGTVAAVGAKLKGLKVDDRVYASSLINPKGGFYAQYCAVKADSVSPIPGNLSTEQAAAMSSDALTGLRGLADIIALKSGETIMIFGAGGGIGHLAVQLAKTMGARVFAVASGDDGVDLARRLGADAVVNGRKDDIAAAARAFAPAGLDAALMTAGGDAANRALAGLRDGGRVAYPNGVEPAPQARAGVTVTAYDVVIDRPAIDRLNRLIAAGPFDVHIARSFPFSEAPAAHRYLDQHYLGKLALRIS